MKVTIAITCYNYGRFLKEAVDSALVQSYPAHEIFVVDDGSEDHSAEIARSYGQRIHFISRPHQGICEVRNFVLKEAKGDALVFLDADDRLHPDHLLKTVAAWEQAPCPKPAFIYHQRSILDHPDQISCFPEFAPATLKQKNYILVSSLFILSAVRNVTYDPAFREGLEDYDFILSLLEKNMQGLRVDLPLLFVRLHHQTRSLSCGRADVRSRLLQRMLHKHRALYSRSEAKLFRRNIREYVLRKLAEPPPPQTLKERQMHLKLLLCYRAHPGRIISLFLPAKSKSFNSDSSPT